MPFPTLDLVGLHCENEATLTKKASGKAPKSARRWKPRWGTMTMMCRGWHLVLWTCVGVSAAAVARESQEPATIESLVADLGSEEATRVRGRSRVAWPARQGRRGLQFRR